MLQKSSQRTDEYIRMIKDELDAAVQQCIEAAGQEFEPAKQKALLRVGTSSSPFLMSFSSVSWLTVVLVYNGRFLFCVFRLQFL
jgi:Vps16, N-terminal region